MFTEDGVIFTYTSAEAVEDGILFDLVKAIPNCEHTPFNLVTTNLLRLGYIRNNVIDLEALRDLIRQCTWIVNDCSDYFYSGVVEFANGMTDKVFICQNETSKFTIMLPEDY